MFKDRTPSDYELVLSSVFVVCVFVGIGVLGTGSEQQIAMTPEAMLGAGATVTTAPLPPPSGATAARGIPQQKCIQPVNNGGVLRTLKGGLDFQCVPGCEYTVKMGFSGSSVNVTPRYPTSDANSTKPGLVYYVPSFLGMGTGTKGPFICGSSVAATMQTQVPGFDRGSFAYQAGDAQYPGTAGPNAAMAQPCAGYNNAGDSKCFAIAGKGETVYSLQNLLQAGGSTANAPGMGSLIPDQGSLPANVPAPGNPSNPSGSGAFVRGLLNPTPVVNEGYSGAGEGGPSPNVAKAFGDITPAPAAAPIVQPGVQPTLPPLPPPVPIAAAPGVGSPYVAPAGPVMTVDTPMGGEGSPTPLVPRYGPVPCQNAIGNCLESVDYATGQRFQTPLGTRSTSVGPCVVLCGWPRINIKSTPLTEEQIRTFQNKSGAGNL